MGIQSDHRHESKELYSVAERRRKLCSRLFFVHLQRCSLKGHLADVGRKKKL